jgi:hypothetical protein
MTEIELLDLAGKYVANLEPSGYQVHEVFSSVKLTYNAQTVDVAGWRPRDSHDAAAIFLIQRRCQARGSWPGSSSQHCSQPDAATKQHRSRKQPYCNPSLNSRPFIGSASIPNAFSGSGGSVTDVLYYFLPEHRSAVAHPLCEEGSSPDLNTFRGMFKFSCGGSDRFDDFVSRLLQHEAVQRDHRHNRVIRVDPDSMFDRDLCGELL